MLKVYVAGAYSANNIMDVFSNMRRGQHVAYKVIKAGMAPFVPWFDYQFSLIGPMEIKEYYEYSIAFEKCCDCVLVIRENLEGSNGTAREIEIAKSMGLPIFYIDAEELLAGKYQVGWDDIIAFKKQKESILTPSCSKYN